MNCWDKFKFACCGESVLRCFDSSEKTLIEIKTFSQM